MTRERLICIFCKEPIRKSKDEYDDLFDITGVQTQIESAWHFRCIPDRAEPDSPFQAAVQKAKQAIADAQRLSEEERVVFTDVVKIALTEQRPDLAPTQEPG